MCSFRTNLPSRSDSVFSYEDDDDGGNEFKKVFQYVRKNNLEGLKKIKIDYNTCEGKGQSILQFACGGGDKKLEIIKHLLENGANPNLLISSKPETPLQIAFMKSSEKIIDLLLQHKQTIIDENLFSYIVQQRGRNISPKYFASVLESDKIGVNYKIGKSRNTPLHYAVITSNTKAIDKLLKRGASLWTQNEYGKTPLSFMNFQNLKGYFDSCLLPDNRCAEISDQKYKMFVRFNGLITEYPGVEPTRKCGEIELNPPTVEDTEESRLEGSHSRNFQELKLVHKLAKDPNLQPLLTHPLVQIFIYLKWHKCRNYFWAFVIFQTLIFTSFSVLFFNLHDLCTGLVVLCTGLVVANVFIKMAIVVYSWTGSKKKKSFKSFLSSVKVEASMYCFIEILIIITTLVCLLLRGMPQYLDQTRAFLFVQLPICFLLTLGYHPDLSKWSIMLQTVLKTFFCLALFFSILIFGFSAGFTVLFSKDDVFNSTFTSFFISTVMTTGELNAKDLFKDTQNPVFGHYFFFLIFTTCMCLVIANFWTGVAVSDVERIEKDSEINACWNIVGFLRFIEWIHRGMHTSRWMKKLHKCLPKPYVFEETNPADKKKYSVDIFINNRKEHFKNCPGFPKKIDAKCLYKIKEHQEKMMDEKKSEENVNSLNASVKKNEDLLNNLIATVKNIEHIVGTLQKRLNNREIHNGIGSERADAGTSNG